MASTANSVSPANRASGNNLNPSQNTGARQSLRTNASFKGADANRRQSASPGDGAQRYVMTVDSLSDNHHRREALATQKLVDPPSQLFTPIS